MRTAADYYDEDDIIYDTLLVGICSEMDWMDVTRDITVSVDVIHGSKIKWADWH